MAKFQLISAGSKKLEVIKIMVENTPLGLKESKDVVDAAPAYFESNLTKAQAEALVKEFAKIGAKVIIAE